MEYRLRVEQDELAENPLTWDNGEFVMTGGRHGTWGSAEHELARVFELAEKHGQDGEAAAERHIKRNGIVAERLVIGGNDWVEGYVIAGDSGYAETETYEAWRNGEVYVVFLEGKCECCGEWRIEDSLGGCYLDDDYTARDVAREYFGGRGL